MKIYTRTGDDGTTGLLGRDRVSKAEPRVEAYGSVDELNAWLGMARAQDAERWIAEDLARVQAELFRLGAELACSDRRMLERLDRLGEPDVARLEAWIDRLEAELTPLASFVLPGGAPLAAQLHVARTVCRRAERRVVALPEGSVAPVLVRYLNRLADLLFVLARWCNARAGVPETLWQGNRP